MASIHALYWNGIDPGVSGPDHLCLEQNQKQMNYQNPAVILLSSVMITVMGLRIKEECHWCFIGLFLTGLILFIFGILKYLRRRNG
jgi:undecaprenyl pyrophosphate phosphatase UppP